MDKELEIYRIIDGESSVTQRQIADRTGLSLGAVNVLLKKMIREGMIKLVKIPANRTLYMLTPKGLNEKANKTLFYIRHYYKFITEVKEKLSSQLKLHGDVGRVHLEISDDTLRDIALQAVRDCGMKPVDSLVEAELIITDGEYSGEKIITTIYTKEVIGT